MEKSAFSQMYIVYYPKLFNFVSMYLPHEEVKDLVQDIFIDLLDIDMAHIKRFDSYLFTLTKNRCLDWLKHNACVQRYESRCKNEYEIQLETLAAFDGFDEAIDEAEHQEWLTKMVMRQMNELPDRCREIFEMCKLQGLRYAEVAEQLGISVNTVECQMGIALKKLRTALQPIRPS